MALSQQFTDRIGVVAIEQSKFEDSQGFWAKRWEQVVRVGVRFVDGTIVYLAPDEFNALSHANQELIRNAPSEGDNA